MLAPKHLKDGPQHDTAMMLHVRWMTRQTPIYFHMDGVCGGGGVLVAGNMLFFFCSAGLSLPSPKKKNVCVCVCVCERERERTECVCVCVCVCVEERKIIFFFFFCNSFVY